MSITNVGGGSDNANVGGNQLTTSSLNVASGALVILNTGVAFSSANGGTTLSGSGTIQLNGSNTYWHLGNGGSGTTVAMTSGGLIDVEGGTLAGDYSNANWTSNQGSLKVATGAALNLFNDNVTVDALNGGGNIFDTYTNTLTMGVANGSGNFTGTIGVGGTTVSLIKSGSGTQILGGTNTYTGSTTISSVGTLQIGGSGQLGSGSYAGAIAISSGGTLEYSSSANQTFSGTISGAGAILKDTSSSTLDLSAEILYRRNYRQRRYARIGSFRHQRQFRPRDFCHWIQRHIPTQQQQHEQYRNHLLDLHHPHGVWHHQQDRSRGVRTLWDEREHLEFHRDDQRLSRNSWRERQRLGQQCWADEPQHRLGRILRPPHRKCQRQPAYRLRNDRHLLQPVARAQRRQ